MNNIINELINNNANPYVLFDTKDLNKTDRKNAVESASSEELKQIIVKFDGHEMFDFLEDFICDGGCENMSEEEYWEFIEESGL